MKTIISTFGEAPGGIIEGIKQFGCQKLVLLLSDMPQTKKSIRGLRKIEKNTIEMNIPLEKIIMPPYSIMDNVHKIKQVIIENGNNVILNITGGRKTLSLAAALAGFVTNPEKIIYIQEEDNKPIEIPKFTIYEKLLSNEKRIILNVIKKNTNLNDIKKLLKNQNISKNEPILRKHLRDLERKELIEIDKNSRPHKYNITPSGELLR